MPELHTLYWLGGTIGTIGVTMLTLRRLGIVQFYWGTKITSCPDPDMRERVEATRLQLVELKGQFKEFKDGIYPKINQMAEDIAKIKGYLEGLQNAKNPNPQA